MKLCGFIYQEIIILGNIPRIFSVEFLCSLLSFCLDVFCFDLMFTPVLLFSVYDQTGHPREREHR